MPSLQPPPRPPVSRLSSPSMRHLKARLQVLRRPMVWGSAAVLLAAGYFLSSYWSNLTALTQRSSQTPSSSRQNPLYRPQTADPGSSSGFGNLPGLSDSMGQPGMPGLTPVPSAASRQPSSTNPFAASSPQGGISPVPGSLDSSLSNGTNPVSSYSSGGFDTPRAGSSDLTPGSSMVGSDRPSAAGSAPVNPLQSALDRTTHSTSAPSNASTSAAQPSNSSPSATPTLPDTLSGTSPGSSAAPGSSSSTAPDTVPLSPVGQPGFQPYVPRTSPPPGTTGYTVPPAFRTPASSSSESNSGFSNFSRPQPLPGDYSAPLNPPSATQPMLPSSSSSGYGSGSSYTAPAGAQPAQSFSVPRSAPGQAIGGGQINTFSNP